MTKKSRHKLKHFESGKRFWGKIKTIFHHFKGLSAAKKCLRPKSASLRKEISRLLSKEMSNIYLKVAIEEKNWRSQNLNFLGLKNLSQCQFWGTPSGVDKFLSRHPNFRARKYKTGCSKQKCISDQETTRNIAFCWDAFGTWMLFDYLK